MMLILIMLLMMMIIMMMVIHSSQKPRQTCPPNGHWYYMSQDDGDEVNRGLVRNKLSTFMVMVMMMMMVIMMMMMTVMMMTTMKMTMMMMNKVIASREDGMECLHKLKLTIPLGIGFNTLQFLMLVIIMEIMYETPVLNIVKIVVQTSNCSLRQLYDSKYSHLYFNSIHTQEGVDLPFLGGECRLWGS